MPPGPHSRKCTPYLLGGPGGMPLALRLSEGLGRILAEDFVDFHADKAFKTWEIKVHAREPLP